MESLYGGQFTLLTQLIKPNYLVNSPPAKHHSLFRNLPRLFIYDIQNIVNLLPVYWLSQSCRIKASLLEVQRKTSASLSEQS